ncbi:MAG: hypothetical protein ACYSUX_08780 [Planctomycetota bacterium]|jgi:hypothetical protein
MLNFLYRAGNALAFVVFTVTAGIAVYNFAPDLWTSFDNTLIGSSAILAIIGVMVVGFLATESRKV